MDKLKEIVKEEGSNLFVLDVGTGVGSFVKVLQESLPGYSRIIGIDPSEKAVNKAAESFEDKRIEFRCMNGEQMEFEDNVMDVVSISNTLHHLPNKEEVLSEIKRVLKPGGLFILNEMFCDNQSTKQLSHVEVHHLQGELDTLQGICHNKTYTLQQLVEIAESLHFEKVNMFLYNTHKEQEKTVNPEEEKEILEDCFTALTTKIENLKDMQIQQKYLETLEKLKKKLYPIGFFGATEAMIVCRK